MNTEPMRLTPGQVAAAMYEAQTGLLRAKAALAVPRVAQEDLTRYRGRKAALRAFISDSKRQLSICQQIFTVFPAAND